LELGWECQTNERGDAMNNMKMTLQDVVAYVVLRRGLAVGQVPQRGMVIVSLGSRYNL